jgi:6-phosphogluconate dehydrogenase
VLKVVVGMSNEDMANLFDEWNKGELSSYLIEITAKILRKRDDKTGEGYVVDYVLDKTGMKGTGKWTVQEGAEKSVAVSTMASALDARMLSARKEERVAASAFYVSPTISTFTKEQVLEDLRVALYASKLCSYAQGLSLIKAASDEYSWGVSLAECARLWTGGCIIRAKLLDDIQQAFTKNSGLSNLLMDPDIVATINTHAPAWRRTISLCVLNGIPAPALSNSLSYFDMYRRARLPANLTQAQRDFFGGHTYERTDSAGHFHTAWTEAHKDIGDIDSRTKGEKLQTN